MVDISAIAGTISALKGAVDISKAIVGLHDAQAIQAKVIELNAKILDAQSTAFTANDERAALIERIGKLEKQIADAKAWGAEKQRYELKAIDTGVFAYMPKAGMEHGEPPHWLCTTCYQADKKSFLQFQIQDGRKHVYRCNGCQGPVLVDFHVSPNGDTRLQTPQ